MEEAISSYMPYRYSNAVISGCYNLIIFTKHHKVILGIPTVETQENEIFGDYIIVNLLLL